MRQIEDEHELVGDVGWYWVGYRYGERFIKRFGKYVSITDKHVEVVKKMFEKHHMKILTISKLTTGLGFAPIVLFTAGMSRVSFRKYIEVNVLWQFIWSILLLGIGYYFGNIYYQTSSSGYVVIEHPGAAPHFNKQVPSGRQVQPVNNQKGRGQGKPGANGHSNKGGR